ncbi:MAG TPA: protein arginine kinase [Rhabdochlamydiaceae bacterium]
MEKTELPPFLFHQGLWDKSANPLWPLSTFVLQRNLSSHLFPQKMDQAELVKTVTVLQELVLKHVDSAHLMPSETLSPLDKEFLFEHFFCLESFQNANKGQAFIIDPTANFLAQLNIQDHLHLQLIDQKGSWEKNWEQLSKLENALCSTLEFAYSPKFGYLTADPTHCGTALTASAYLHLPALNRTGQLKEWLTKNKEDGVTVRGLQGAADDFIGDFLVLSNAYTLGLSEETIFHTLHNTATKLVLEEKAQREQLKKEAPFEIKDQVCRAYGLVMHSYQLHIKEALDALSLIQLGLDLGWITGIAHEQLTHLFFHCRRAHLAFAFKEKTLDPNDLARKRAEYLHTHLANIQITI